MPSVILELPKTKIVKYSQRPLNGKDDQIIEIKAQEFAHQHQFEWHDDLLIEDKFIETYKDIKPNLEGLAIGYLVYQGENPGAPIDESAINDKNMPFLQDDIKRQNQIAQHYLSQIETTLPHLVICEIDSRVGKGLFWCGLEPIKKGTAVICYSGIIDTLIPGQISGYEFSIPAHPIFKKHTGVTGIARPIPIDS